MCWGVSAIYLSWSRWWLRHPTWDPRWSSPLRTSVSQWARHQPHRMATISASVYGSVTLSGSAASRPTVVDLPTYFIRNKLARNQHKNLLATFGTADGRIIYEIYESEQLPLSRRGICMLFDHFQFWGPLFWNCPYVLMIYAPPARFCQRDV